MPRESCPEALASSKSRKELTDAGLRTKTFIENKVFCIAGGTHRQLKTESVEQIMQNAFTSLPCTKFVTFGGREERYYDYATAVNTIISGCIRAGRVSQEVAQKRGYPVSNPGPLQPVVVQY